MADKENNPKVDQYYKYAKNIQKTKAFAKYIKKEMEKYKNNPTAYKKNRELEIEREALESPELSAQLDKTLNLNKNGGVKKNIGIIHMSSENMEQPQTTPPRTMSTQEEDMALLDTLRMESRKRKRDSVVSERQGSMKNSKARRKLNMDAVKGGKRRRKSKKNRKSKKSRKSRKRNNKSRRRRSNKRRRTRRKR